MRRRFSPRLGYFLGFVVCTALLGFALYLQYVEHQEPCPLCILQRYAFVGLALVFLAAAVHGPGALGSAVYSGFLLVIAGAGAAVASRHVWLQHLPGDRVPECGPGLEYLISRFPLSQALDKIFSGSGECAEVGWRFLGLSIAEWSLLWFVAMGLFAVVLAVLARRREDMK